MPLHSGVWAYVDDTGVAWAGGGSAGGDVVRQWVDIAEGLPGNTRIAAVQAGGTVPTGAMYMDCFRIYTNPGDSIPMLSAGLPESAWLHHPTTGDRLAVRRDDGSIRCYFVNPADPWAKGWLVNYARTHYSRFAALMLDDVAPSLALALYGSGVETCKEYTTDTQWVVAVSALLTSLIGTWRLYANTIPGSCNPYLPSGLVQYSSVDGQIAEGVPFSADLPSSAFPDQFVGAVRVAHYLDLVAQLPQLPHLALVNKSDTRGISQRRRVAIALHLLAFTPQQVYLWNDTATSALGVYPEQGIYPTRPVKSLAGSSHASLMVAPDVYVREFSLAYHCGNVIGPLAVVLNAGDGPITVGSWFTRPFTHAVGWTGATVDGAYSFNPQAGAAGTSIPPRDAVLLTA